MTDTPDTIHRIHPDLRSLARPIGELNEDPANANSHNDASLAGIAASFIRFGQRKNIVVRREGMVIEAGNGTLAALKAAGWTHLACSVCDDDEDTAKAYALADNNRRSTWDMNQLAQNVGELLAADYDLTGLWSDDELKVLADRTWVQPSIGIIAAEDDDQPAPDSEPADTVAELQVDPAPEVIPEPPTEPITQPCDLITMGDHRLICGSCRDPETVARLLDGEKINVAFTSPPYASQRKYDETSGFKPIKPDEYVEWFEAVQANVREHLAVDGSFFVNIKPHSEGLALSLYVLDLAIAMGRTWGWHYAAEFCWERIGVPGYPKRRFKNQFEAVYQFAVREWKFRPKAVQHASTQVPPYSRDNKMSGGLAGIAGSKGKNFAQEVDGFAYPGNRLPAWRNDNPTTHAAVFPVGLPTFFIKAYSDPGDIIFDPFEGSGTTIIAAEREKRRGYGCEISPKYCDVAVQRWENETGRKAERESLDGTISVYMFPSAPIPRRVPARPGDKPQARRRIQTRQDSGAIDPPGDLPCHDCGDTTCESPHEYDHYLGYGEDKPDDQEHVAMCHETVQAVCASCHHKREAARVAALS